MANGTAFWSLEGGISQNMSNILVVYCSVLLLIGVVGNGLTIIVLFYARSRVNDTNSSLLNSSTVLLLNLSISDLLYSAICLPLWIVVYLERGWYYGRMMCQAMCFVRHVVVNSAIASLCAMMLNRALVLWCPAINVLLFEYWGVIPVMLSIWLFAIVPWVPSFFEDYYSHMAMESNWECVALEDPKNLRPSPVLSTLLIIPSVIIITSLVMISVKVWMSWNDLKNFCDTDSTSMEQLRRRNLRLSMIFLLLGTSYIICVGPSIVVFYCCSMELSHPVFLLANCLLYIFFPLNFFLYVLRIPSYRRAFGDFFKVITECCRK